MTKEGAFKGAVALSVIGSILWVCAYMYWHFKIMGAVTTMMNQSTPPKPGSALTKEKYAVPDEPLDEIEDAGCRALPYLVNSLDPDKNPAYLLVATDLLRKITAPKETGGNASNQCPDVRMSLDDGPGDRKSKCDQIRDWWVLHGKELHQGWRVWSNHCARD